MKAKEELNAIKEEVETLNKKLAELTEEELAQVSGCAELSEEALGAAVGGTSDESLKDYLSDRLEEAEDGVRALVCDESVRGLFGSVIGNCRTAIAMGSWSMAAALGDCLISMIDSSHDLWLQEAGIQIRIAADDIRFRIRNR